MTDYTAYTGSKAGVREYMHTVSDGVKLKVIDFTPLKIEEGRPVIVFIAGWISLIRGWRDFLSALTPHYRVIYAETREKGSSVIPDIKSASFSMERMKDDIQDLVKGLLPEGAPLVLAGSSLGASAIMEYCMSGGREPMCTALVGPNGEFRFPRFLSGLIPVLHPSLYFAVKPVIKWYLRNFRVNSEAEREQIEKYELTLDHADPYRLKRNALAIKNWSIKKDGTITVPSLILGATTDSLHNTDNLKRVLKHFPRGEYIELASNRETHSAKAAHVIMDYIERIASTTPAEGNVTANP